MSFPRAAITLVDKRMARLPDRFDLWVRKARGTVDPERQMDWVLGAVIALTEVYFLNVGTRVSPRIARTEIAPHDCALVFTGLDRLEEFVTEQIPARLGPEHELPVIASPSPAALRWCAESGIGLVLNPGVGEAAAVPPDGVAAFLTEWSARGGRKAQGFWIPNMTTEEEDFWQENGL